MLEVFIEILLDRFLIIRLPQREIEKEFLATIYLRKNCGCAFSLQYRDDSRIRIHLNQIARAKDVRDLIDADDAGLLKFARYDSCVRGYAAPACDDGDCLAHEWDE